MKFSLLLFIFIYSFTAYSNWYPFGKTGANTVWMKKQKCESVEAQECFDITNKIVDTQSIVSVDNLESPIFRDPNDSTVKIDCDSVEDCTAKAYTLDGDGNITDNVCSSDGNDPRFAESNSWLSVIGITGDYFIWCQVVIGYHQNKVLQEDSTKKAAYEAAKAQADQVKSMAAAGEKAIQVGTEAKKLMVGYIKLKALPKAQRKQLRTDLKSIISALDVGSIDVAIEEIQALTEDPVVVTPEAKALILKVFTDAGYAVP